MNKQRLEAFTDGVIAIIITIMVLDLKIPAGTQTGRSFRLKNLGVPIVHSQNRGDMHVQIKVVTPKTGLTRVSRAARVRCGAFGCLKSNLLELEGPEGESSPERADYTPNRIHWNCLSHSLGWLVTAAGTKND